MNKSLRNHLKLSSKTVVIKLGSLAVTSVDGGIETSRIWRIVSDISILVKEHHLKVVIVSSGAINAGRLFVGKLSENVATLQACAAVGQPLLIQEFQQHFKKFKLQCAQVLLTHEDFKHKKRAHNVRGGLLTLLDHNIIPIVNENDSVSFDEITVGDNDQLSAMICEMIDADVLCMLTATDGLYDRNPQEINAQHVPLIEFDDDFSRVSTLSKSSIGRGGMKTKVQAIRKLTPLGISVIIGSFDFKRPIQRLLIKDHGSLFKGNPSPLLSRKQSWIMTRVRNDAVIKIDEGAYQALGKNASLLPIGILKVEGNFSRGDSIVVKFKNKIIGYGITEYSNLEVGKIKGLRSTEIIKVLKSAPAKAVIHKNNLMFKKD